MLRKELGIFTFADLLEHYPLRHIDRTKIEPIQNITPETEFIQVKGILHNVEMLGERQAKRLTADVTDDTGTVELIWFQGINWVQKSLKEGEKYIAYGKAGFFNGHPQITHPEMELLSDAMAAGKPFLEPVYPTTEKLKARGLTARNIAKLTNTPSKPASAASGRRLPTFSPVGSTAAWRSSPPWPPSPGSPTSPVCA